MNQLTLDSYTGAALKQAGLDQVEANNQSFVDIMRAYAKVHVLIHGSVTTDHLRLHAEQIGLQPTHPNCWGSLLRGKHWRVIGRQPTRLEQGHHREIKVYRYEP